MKKIITIVFAVLLAYNLYAQQPMRVPAYQGLIERVQPNGDTLRTYLRGDERSHYMMTEDGWQISEDAKGWLRYTKRNRKGELVTGCRKARNAENRSQCEKRWLKKHGVMMVQG